MAAGPSLRSKLTVLLAMAAPCAIIRTDPRDQVRRYGRAVG